ncbi:aminotransferase class V-fold PLP-dependent enzyme [Methylocystis sp. 9N]|uniref:Aminotransferase class V-fold PLP-dependent enzyme n=1 Tax=Methylocystis borbori TaxID=3118750 RepID=A0ABU7XEL9_9HYPH
MSNSRIPGKNFLFVPGPTNLPDRVVRAMAVPSEDHRSPIFPDLVKPLFPALKKVFKTETGAAFIFPASGTGGWEAAITNTLSPGDKVIAQRFGQFSHLWIDLCQRIGLDVIKQEREWGTGNDPELIEETLKADKNHEIKAVLATHNETATGVTSDIAAVRKAIDAAKHPALLFVDGVSSVGSLPFEMDAWGVDVIVSGSQKGFMLPAGLALLGVSEKALKAGETAQMRRAYFEFKDMLNANKQGYFPYTPALPLLYGLKESLSILFEEGLDQVYKRHHHLAEGVRAAVAAWGLKPCAKEPKWNSDTVTAIVVPEGFDAAKVIEIAYKRYNLALGAGLSEVAGKVFRIGHLGDLNELMVLGAVAGAEMAMLDVGIPVTAGSGVAAAQAVYRANPLLTV